jgi:hypothetical protein
MEICYFCVLKPHWIKNIARLDHCTLNLAYDQYLYFRVHCLDHYIGNAGNNPIIEILLWILS